MLPFPNRATLSIVDLYNVDETLFDEMELPPDFDTESNRETLVNQILMRSKDFEALYPDAVFMKTQIKYWSEVRDYIWKKVYTLSLLEYNPIENYDRMEESSEIGHNATERTGEALSARAGSNSQDQSEDRSEISSETGTNNQNQKENHAESSSEAGAYNQNLKENRAEISSEAGTNNQNQKENRAESSTEAGSESSETKKAGFNTTTLETQSGQNGSSSAQRAATAENTTTGDGSSSAQKAATAENTSSGDGSSSAQRAATSENTTTGDGSSSAQRAAKAANTTKGTGTTTETSTGRTNENENSKHNVLRTSRIHGNIGVTTPAQMLRGDLEIYPDLNLIHRIVEDFVSEFCIMVY